VALSHGSSLTGSGIGGGSGRADAGAIKRDPSGMLQVCRYISRMVHDTSIRRETAQ